MATWLTTYHDEVTGKRIGVINIHCCTDLRKALEHHVSIVYNDEGLLRLRDIDDLTLDEIGLPQPPFTPSPPISFCPYCGRKIVTEVLDLSIQQENAEIAAQDEGYQEFLKRNNL